MRAPDPCHGELHAQIPLAPGQKAPPLVEWTEFQHRLPTEEERDARRTRWPDANWGVVTGAASGVIVLDVDARRGGEAALQGRVLPATLTVRTPSGGWHYYFRHLGGHVPCVPDVLPGCDLKGDGGYVVAAGSRLNGAAYEVAVPEPPAPAPDWLLCLIRDRGGAEEETGKCLPPSEVLRLLRGVPEGERNASAARLAGRLLAGATKIGKTQLVLQLARAASAGESFCGLSVPAPVPVLFLGQEDAWWGLRERLRGIHPRFGPPQVPLHLVAGKGVLLEGPEVRRLVSEHRPGLVILDPLRRFHTREEEKGEMAQVIRQVDLLIRDFGCAVLLVHHLRKPPADKGRRTPDVADVRGSSVITDQANTIALLAEDEDQGAFTLTVTGNYAERHTLRLQRVGAVFERRRTNEGLTVREAVEAFADRGPLHRAEAVKVLIGRGLSRSQAYQRVADLERAGWLRAGEDGRLSLEERLLDAPPDNVRKVRPDWVLAQW